MPKNKKQVTRSRLEYAIRLCKRALQLQGDMYDFADVLKDEMGLENLSQRIEDGAFEMDLTWNNTEYVVEKLFEIYKKQ